MVFERFRRVEERNPNDRIVSYASKRLGKSEEEVKQLWRQIEEERQWDPANTKALFQHVGARLKMYGAKKEEIERILQALKEHEIPTADKMMLLAHAIEMHRKINSALPRAKIPVKNVPPEVVAKALAERYMAKFGGGADRIAAEIVRDARIDVNTMHRAILDIKKNREERVALYRRVFEIMEEMKKKGQA